MEIFLNYEKFSKSRITTNDQLICLLKGNATVITMNQTNIDLVDIQN